MKLAGARRVFLVAATLAAGCDQHYTIDSTPGPEPMQKTISVTGTAKLEVQPDEASVEYTFSSTEKKIAAAHAKTAAKIDAFIKTLEAAGVPKSDVVFGYTNYSPDYVYEENKPGRIVTFTATTSITVKTKDFKKIPAIVEAGILANPTSLGSVQFYSTNLPEHKKKVRDMALKAVKDKAEQIARGLDVKLGKAISVSEGGWSSSAYRYYGPSYGYGYGYGWGGNVANVAQAQGVSGQPSEMSGPISPGTTPLELTVDVVFEIK